MEGKVSILPQQFGVCVKTAVSEKNDHIFAYTQPTHWIFRTVKDIVSIFYRTKSLVRRLCVGGDMIIFLRPGGFCNDPQFSRRC